MPKREFHFTITGHENQILYKGVPGSYETCFNAWLEKIGVGESEWVIFNTSPESLLVISKRDIRSVEIRPVSPLEVA